MGRASLSVGVEVVVAVVALSFGGGSAILSPIGLCLGVVWGMVALGCVIWCDLWVIWWSPVGASMVSRGSHFAHVRFTSGRVCPGLLTPQGHEKACAGHRSGRCPPGGRGLFAKSLPAKQTLFSIAS